MEVRVFGRGEGVVEDKLFMEQSGERQNGGDQKPAAPSGTVMPVVSTPQSMPRSAWGCHLHSRAQNEKPTASPGAETKELP